MKIRIGGIDINQSGRGKNKFWHVLIDHPWRDPATGKLTYGLSYQIINQAYKRNVAKLLIGTKEMSMHDVPDQERFNKMELGKEYYMSPTKYGLKKLYKFPI